MTQPPADLDDNACMTLAQRGDVKAFSILVRRYQDRVYRFLLRLVRSADDAVELTQDTFLRAYQNLERWRPDSAFKTWLFSIARNLAFDRLRRGKLVEFVELEGDMALVDPAGGPEAAFETAQEFHRLEAALARLTPDHREILLLREIEEMSYDEIAAVLGLNAGTVRSRIARARLALLDLVRTQQETRK